MSQEEKSEKALSFNDDLIVLIKDNKEWVSHFMALHWNILFVYMTTAALTSLTHF